LAANGLGYGPFRDGQGPEYSPPIIPRIEQLEEDLRFLARITKRIRTYKTTNTQANIPHLAKRFGIGVAQGIELGTDDAENEKQIAVAVQMAREGSVESLIVGNEVLSAGIVAKSKLLDYLRKVRQLAPKNVPVTTAEVWDIWNKDPELAASVDFVMAHFYPFWEKRPVADANESLWRNYDTLRKTLRRVYPDRDVRIVIGETGWPSGGAPLGLAVPGPQNQRRYIEEFMASACAKSVPFYFFQAFDEQWKWKEGLSSGAWLEPSDRWVTGKWIGSSWGLYQSNGRLKPALAGLFEQPAPGSRLNREILVHGQPAAHYHVGLDAPTQQRVSFSRSKDALKITYAAGQRGATVSIRVGEPADAPSPWKDFSHFDAVSVELRGARGRENVLVGIKDLAGSDDGKNARVPLRDIRTHLQTYTIPLSQFASSQVPIRDALTQLNIVLQFYFTGPREQTIYIRNIQYLASK
jgi:exo-beta-1,3-glucanase (GH17 family)